VAIVCIVVVIAIICAAFAVFFIIGGDDERSFTVTYYKKGDKMSEESVPAGTSVIIYEDMGVNGNGERFVGWNTKPDLSGRILLPGSHMTVNESVSLFAMMMDSETFLIILPEKQEGFTITADPMVVNAGGSSIISYSLLPSHDDDNLVITVNGNPMKLDAMKRIHLDNIRADQIIAVSGVFDKREHSITLPAGQVGYILTSSADRVHQGESYTLEYKLLPGYKQSSDFGIHVNGGDAKFPSGGVLIIKDVMDNHKITVTGVYPVEYTVSSGKNISVLVNGTPGSKATVEDLITIQPDEGYAIPDTFDAQITGSFTAYPNGYRIAGNTAFPSVLMITAGDNVKMNGGNSGTIFVCPGDGVNVGPAPGYSLPDNYADKAVGLSGVKYSAEKFFFGSDTVLPSVYKVLFNGYNKVHATFYVVGGDECPIPATNPQRDFYHFDKWQDDLKIVSNDVQTSATWIPDEYTVTFGSNLAYSINGEPFALPGSHIVTVEDFVTIQAVPGYELPAGYLPQYVFIKKNAGYNIISDYALASIFFVQYWDDVTGLSKKYFYSESEMHTIVNPKSQVKPLFTFDLDGTGYDISDFIGWTCDDALYTNDTIIVDKDILFLSLWREE